MPRNREAVLHSDDNEFLVDLEKEPEGSGTISGHAWSSIRGKSDDYDSDEDSTPPPQPQERFMFPPSDSEDENEVEHDNGRKPRPSKPAKKPAPLSRNRLAALGVSDAEEDEETVKAKKKNQADKYKQHHKSDDRKIPEAVSTKKTSSTDSKAHSRKDKPVQEGKNAGRKVDPRTTKDIKPLQPIRHKALESIESGDWIASPKAHGPGFELLGEEGEESMEVATPPATRDDDCNAPFDQAEQGADYDDAPPLEPLAPADLRALRGALRSSFAFRGVVVGRILSAAAHPKAAGLAVLVVDAGGDRGGGVTAVCETGHGLAAGELVAFAPVGAELPSEELAGTTSPVRAARIRGVASAGILCSARRLGLAAEAGGAGDSGAGGPQPLRLPRSCPVGADLGEAYLRRVRPELWAEALAAAAAAPAPARRGSATESTGTCAGAGSTAGAASTADSRERSGGAEPPSDNTCEQSARRAPSAAAAAALAAKQALLEEQQRRAAAAEAGRRAAEEAARRWDEEEAARKAAASARREKRRQRTDDLRRRGLPVTQREREQRARDEAFRAALVASGAVPPPPSAAPRIVVGGGPQGDAAAAADSSGGSPSADGGGSSWESDPSAAAAAAGGGDGSAPPLPAAAPRPVGMKEMRRMEVERRARMRALNAERALRLAGEIG